MSLTEIRLRHLSGPWKALAWGYIACLAWAYLFGILNIVMVVGLSPEDIARHYYGSAPQIESEVNESDLDLDSLQENLPAPSPQNLVAEAHFHLFGMSSFFFSLCLLGLLTSLADKVKIIIISLAFVSIIVDNLSFFATRFGGPAFSYLTVFSGALMGIVFTILWLSVAWELCQKK